MGSSALEKALLSTVAYSAQFQYPLTLPEIWTRLMAKVSATDSDWFEVSALTPAQLKRTLRTLADSRRLGWYEPYYFLPDHEKDMMTRHQRAEVAETKWAEIQEFVSHAQKNSWIEAVFVTGSLAVNNTEDSDDSDFMLVTAPRRLWLVRLWMTWYALRKGKRRSWHGEERRSWCFNLWLTSPSLGVFAQKPSLYIAYELIQARCVFDRTGVYGELQALNPWVTTFLPNAKWGRGKRDRVVSRRNLASLVFDGLDWLAYAVQLLYMKRHITREKVSRNWAFFHPRDTEAGIMKKLRSSHVE